MSDLEAKITQIEARLKEVTATLEAKDGEILTLKSENETLSKENAKLNVTNEHNRISNIANLMLTKRGYAFKNAFEKSGFNATLVKSKDGVFLTDVEVENAVTEFLKDQDPPKKKDPDPPKKGDPKKKDPDPPKKKDPADEKVALVKELKSLMGVKDRLNPDQVKRLAEIQKTLCT